MSSEFTILVVDDTRQNVQLLSQILKKEGFKVLAAFSGEDALSLIERRLPDLILMDVMMPGLDGYQVVAKLKQHPDHASIPVIFLSALGDIEAKIKAFDVGGSDYVTKPFQHQEVLARIGVQLRIKQLERVQERYIRELNLQREHLEKLNLEKDEMLGIISHDMRNPLGGIIGITNLLRTESVTDPDELDEMLGLIESSAERLLYLVNDLLDVALIEANSFRLNLQDVNICSMISDVVKLHDPAAKTKKIQVKIDCESDEIMGTIDVSKISQVIGNLLSNAIKFTRESGLVTLRVENHGNDLCITLSDNGIGIPEHLIPHLFTKMGDHQRIGTAGEKGTGLGMPIIKKFIEIHNGQIEVKSVVNEGTTFTITLPQKQN